MNRDLPRTFASLPALAILLLVSTAPLWPTRAHAVIADQLSTRTTHTCALTSDGGVKCWGNNDSGQLGDGTTTTRDTAVDVGGLTSGVAAVAAGGSHTCALTTAGGVLCWGANFAGQLGDGSTTPRLAPVAVVGLSSGVVALTAGSAHTCALMSQGDARCWGSNDGGQLGDGTTLGRLAPVGVAGLTNLVAVGAGAYHTCALTAAGGAKCWGSNYWGQLGDGTTDNRSTAVDVLGLASGVAAFAQGYSHTCAVTAAGGVRCWGFNQAGQLGDGTTTTRTTPVDVVGLTSGAVALAAGTSHTCALIGAGGAKCWGSNDSGQLGDGTIDPRLTPVDVSRLPAGVASLVAGERHTCVVTSGGGVECWGAPGQLGYGNPGRRLTAVDVAGLESGVVALDLQELESCALTATGGAKCWGSIWTGYSLVPLDLPGLTGGVAAVALGYGYRCALTTGGGVKCQGENSRGQLGDGTTEYRPSAVDAIGLSSGIAAIGSGGDHTCAVTTAGGAKCWGANYRGQLGDGTTTDRPVAVDVTGIAGQAQSVDGGFAHTCVLTTAGGVQCWGYNALGQLGDGTTTDRLTPVSVTGLTTGVAALSVGLGHTCALTTAGGVKCWGLNAAGALGDGTTTNSLVPVDVVGLSSGVAVIAAGLAHTCALTTTGGVKCWGQNFAGELGDGTTIDRLTPVDVAGLESGVVTVGAGPTSHHTCALTTMGGAKCWGWNEYGQLGNGESGSFIPTPIDAIGFGPECGNGTIEPTEQCDDGNSASGDCCSSACQFESGATICRAAVDACDVAETCTGVSSSCPADVLADAGTACTDDGDACTSDSCDGGGVCTHVALPDGDEDAVCDAQDACTNVDHGRDLVTKPRAKLILTKVNTDPLSGNDKLTLGGAFWLPGGSTFADLDPQARGARLLIRTAQGGTVIDVTLPATPYAGGGTRGWKTNARRSLWQYLDKSASPLGGITGLKATDRSNGLPGGMVALTVTGKNGTYPTSPADLPLEAILVLGDQSDAIAGRCAESAFTADQCAFNGAGNALKCVR